MAVGILQYRIGTKFGAHKRLFLAFGTIVSSKFRHWPINQKEETLIRYIFLTGVVDINYYVV